MKKLIVSLSLFFATLNLYAGIVEMPKSIDDYYAKGIKVELIELKDPEEIVLKLLDNHTTISGNYTGVGYKMLEAWRDNKTRLGKKPILVLKYTNKHGTEVYDIQGKIHFKLIGNTVEHPITIAISDCKDTFYPTFAMIDCMYLGLEAWNAELNRAYQALGGDNNSELKKAQLAWMKYRDAQAALIRKEYGNSDGTMWRLIVVDAIVHMTEQQAKLLHAISRKSPY
ncbi:MAG: DUF1311 domain-containing protein [Campylobacterales bacterium]|nr:DUF1311 domain-containing protein [Campylobacterales bacterium]